MYFGLFDAFDDDGVEESGYYVAGVGLLVSKFAAAGLFPDLHYVVGFDDGDITEITT